MNQTQTDLANQFPIGTRVTYPWGRGARSGTVAAAPRENGKIPLILRSERAAADKEFDADPGRISILGAQA